MLIGILLTCIVSNEYASKEIPFRLRADGHKSRVRISSNHGNWFQKRIFVDAIGHYNARRAIGILRNVVDDAAERLWNRQLRRNNLAALDIGLGQSLGDTGTGILHVHEDHISGNVVPDIHQAVPERLFDLQTAADPQRCLPEKIFFIHH